jgi:hypothetical protein
VTGRLRRLSLPTFFDLLTCDSGTKRVGLLKLAAHRNDRKVSILSAFRSDLGSQLGILRTTLPGKYFADRTKTTWALPPEIILNPPDFHSSIDNILRRAVWGRRRDFDIDHGIHGRKGSGHNKYSRYADVPRHSFSLETIRPRFLPAKHHRSLHVITSCLPPLNRVIRWLRNTLVPTFC